jgi:hypothetical protein
MDPSNRAQSSWPQRRRSGRRAVPETGHQQLQSAAAKIAQRRRKVVKAGR